MNPNVNQQSTAMAHSHRLKRRVETVLSVCCEFVVPRVVRFNKSTTNGVLVYKNCYAFHTRRRSDYILFYRLNHSDHPSLPHALFHSELKTILSINHSHHSLLILIQD